MMEDDGEGNIVVDSADNHDNYCDEFDFLIAVDEDDYILVIATAKCQQAKQKLKDDRTQFCKY